MMLMEIYIIFSKFIMVGSIKTEKILAFVWHYVHAYVSLCIWISENMADYRLTVISKIESTAET